MALVTELDDLPCTGCRECPLAAGWETRDGEQGGGYAGPSGPTDASVLVVGEAPGAEEVREGAPFVGKSGNTLKFTLKGVGIDPEAEVRYVNVTQCRPPIVAGKQTSPEPLAQAACTILERELESFEGKVVVAVGRTAADRLLSSAFTTRLLRHRSSWDGYVYPWDSDYAPPSEVDLGYGLFDEGEVYKSGKNKGKPKKTKRMLKGRVPRPPKAKAVVGCLHPSFIQRSGFSNIVQFRAALQRAQYLVEDRPIERGPDMQEAITDPSEWEVYARVDKNRPKELVFDIEDSGIGLTRIGFLELYENGGRGRMGTFMWNPAAKALTEKLLVDSPYEVLIAHNGDYDCSRLAQWEGIEVDEGKMLDTMHAAQIQQPDLPKGLGHMWRYIQAPMLPWKAESQDNPAFYNLSDCYYTGWAWLSLRHLLMLKGQLNLLITQTRSSFVLGRMSRGGMRRDMPRLDAWIEQRQRALQDLEREWEELTASLNEDVPVATSGKNLNALLFERLALPILDRTETEQPSTTELVIQKLADQSEGTVHELLTLLLDVRRRRKEISTYVKSYAEKTDEKGFLHPSYLPDVKDAGNLGTAAGRLSSSPNVQNVPKDMRWQFIPDQEGWVIGDSDLSAVENRVAAADAGDQDLLELMDDPTFDPHTTNLQNAQQALLDWWSAVTSKEIKATPQVRKMATRRLEGVHTHGVWPITRRTMKTFIYGWQYGAGDKKIAESLDVHLREAEVIRASYENWRPLMAQHRQRIITQARQQKHLQNVFGRIRWFYGSIPDVHVQNAAINFRPQSTVADMFWLWFPAVESALASYGGRLLTQVHDSFVWTAPADSVTAICTSLDEIMGCEWPQIMPGFRVPVGHEIGPRWGETVPLEEWQASV